MGLGMAANSFITKVPSVVPAAEYGSLSLGIGMNAER